jgi:hypothetical protein
MGTQWDDCAEIPGESSYVEGDSQTQFSDVEEGHPHYVGIRIAEEEGWYAGYPDGTLRPDSNITSEQIAIITERMWPEGATRAEIASFIAAGRFAVIQKSIVLGIDEDVATITNSGSFPIDMSGWKVSWNREDDTDGSTLLDEGTVIKPGETHQLNGGGTLTNVSVSDPYALQVGSHDAE